MDQEHEKRITQGVFDRAAASYGQVGPGYFAHFGQRLVEFARISQGARVLDIASGRGAVLFPAAEAVGPSGAVIGVDLAPGMVDATRRDLSARAIPNTTVMQMDAEHLQFEDAHFDCVLCGFALFFFPDLNRSLAEIRRVLVPGGRLAVSTWGTSQDERWKWLWELFKAYLPPKPELPAADQPPAPDFGTPAGMTAILSGAGFGGIRTTTETADFTFGSEAEWWSTSWSHGSRRNLEEIEKVHGAEGLERFKAEAFERLQALKAPDGFHHQMEVVFAAGQKK